MELLDYHIIKADSIYDTRPTETGLIRLNTAWYREEKELDRYERKLLTGTIVAKPIGYRDTNYMPIDPGFPNPKIFIGHDAIQSQRNQGVQPEWDNTKYHPGICERINYATIADYGTTIDCEVGEKVYFHPSVTEPENLIGDDEYLATVDQIICAVGKNGDIRPQGGYILVKPNLESEDELKSETGLIVKDEVEAKLYEGTIAFCRKGFDLKSGDVILYQEASDWIIKIEGVDYYVMLEENIWMRKK